MVFFVLIVFFIIKPIRIWELAHKDERCRLLRLRKSLICTGAKHQTHPCLQASENSILVSSLGVRLYASRSSAKDFPSKSPRSECLVRTECKFNAFECARCGVFWCNRTKNFGAQINSVPLLLFVSVYGKLKLNCAQSKF